MAAPSLGRSRRELPDERTRRPIWVGIVAALVILLAGYGLWARESARRDAASATEPGGVLSAAQSEGTPLVSVGRTIGLAQPCTAWLLDVGAAAQDGAFAVTAGRCVGIEDPRTVVAGRPLEDATVAFHVLPPAPGAAGDGVVEVPVRDVAWASRRGTDLAILSLAASYEQLAARGLTPSRPIEGPAEDGEILVAGIPVEGVPKDEQYLRGSRCRADRTAHLLEGGLALDSFWVSGCKGMLGGTEGSPAFNQRGEVVGMVATTTIGAEPGHPCTAGRPCEVDGGRAKVATDATYLAPVGNLVDCFDNGRFQPGGKCRLADPAGVVSAVADRNVAKPGASVQVSVAGEGSTGGDSGGGSDATPGGGSALAGAAADPAGPDPQVVAGPAGTLACAEAGTWQDAATSSERLLGPPRGSALATVTLPESDGFTVVCVGSPGNATAVVLEADGTAPDPARIELRQAAVEGGLRVQPVLDPPELSAFRWTSGPSGSIDCATDEGYVDYSGKPSFLEAADLPTTVCIVARDAAGNSSPAVGIDVR